jgi:hypothetical protein
MVFGRSFFYDVKNGTATCFRGASFDMQNDRRKKPEKRRRASRQGSQSSGLRVLLDSSAGGATVFDLLPEKWTVQN